MNIREKAWLVARAAAFATVAIGGLSAGLTITTLTVAKANEVVFAGQPLAAPAPRPTPFVCS